MKTLVDNLYKKGVARLKVTKDYSFEHVTVEKWSPNVKKQTLVIAKNELNSWELI